MMMRLAAVDYKALPAPPSSAQLAAAWSPYMSTAIELFGPDRCMFESNFPVDKMGAATDRCGTHSSESRRALLSTRRWRCSAAPRDGPIVSDVTGRARTAAETDRR
jgi:amidohydrolase family protein